MSRMLDSEEAARRLGVKLATLYAYVSRGMLPSYRTPDGRRSLFDLADVERLSKRSRADRPVEGRLATVTTAVTHLREDGPAYRGHAAVELAGTSTFEDVADLLWAVEGEDGDSWWPAPLDPAPTMAAADLLCWAILLCGARDPLRSDLRPGAVVRKARRAIASAVAALPGSGTASATPRAAPVHIGARGSKRKPIHVRRPKRISRSQLVRRCVPRRR